MLGETFPTLEIPTLGCLAQQCWTLQSGLFTMQCQESRFQKHRYIRYNVNIYAVPRKTAVSSYMMRVTRPVLLVIDGARVHLSMWISGFCNEHNITLYVLHPNSTHLTLPLDLSLMGSNVIEQFRNYNSKRSVTSIEF